MELGQSPSNMLSIPLPKEHDKVLLNEKHPRRCLRIGKLSELIIGRDGQARAAEVISPGNISENHSTRKLLGNNFVALKKN